MSSSVTEPIGARMTDGMDVPRPRLAGALARSLSRTAVAEHMVAMVATELTADVVLSELARLSPRQRVALQRAERQAIDLVGIGLLAGAAHLITAEDGADAIVLHGDGWSLVARTGPVLVFLVDLAPGLVIDRSRADGAAELIDGLATRLTTPRERCR